MDSTNQQSACEYNQILERLVLDTDEGTKERLIGMIAYADYKIEKYEYTKLFCETHSSPNLSSEAIKYFLLAYSESRLQKLRSDAEETLYVWGEHYAESIVEAACTNAVNDSILNEVNLILNEVQRQHSWKQTLLLGISSSILFAFIVFLFGILISVSSPTNNFGRLVKFLVSDAEFMIIRSDDCRLIDAGENCTNDN